MEGAGLVSREVDPDDSRVHRVRLTDEGRRMQGVVIPHRDRSLNAAVEGLNGEEVVELRRLLNRIYENVSLDRSVAVPS